LSRTGVALVIGAALAWQPAAIAEPIFGDWQLDTEQSDNAREMLESVYTQERKKRAKNEPPNAPQLPDWRSPLPLMKATLLSISMQNKQLQIVPDQGKPIQVVPNGEVPPVSLSNWGSQAQTAVRFGLWEGDTLVMESSLDNGTRVIQSYYLNAGGMLVQDTRISRPRAEPIVIKRLFASRGQSSTPGKP
jgi:hypothetical protein